MYWSAYRWRRISKSYRRKRWQARGHRLLMLVRAVFGAGLILMAVAAFAEALALHSDVLIALTTTAALLGVFSIWPPSTRAGRWGVLLPLVAGVVGSLTLYISSPPPSDDSALGSIATICIYVAVFALTEAGAFLVAIDGWGHSIVGLAWKDGAHRAKQAEDLKSLMTTVRQ